MKTFYKQFLQVFTLFSLTVAFAGFSACCPRGRNNPDSPDGKDTTRRDTTERRDTIQPVDSLPKHDRPTWVATDTTDLESTMTVTGRLPESLVATADTADLVAVFSDKECWGVADIQKIGSTPYFFLFITRPHSATHTSSVMLTMRYYCNSTRHIYVQKDVFEFVVDRHLGTIESPFTPALSEYE